jgi:yeast amino acid transporter
MVVRYWDNPGPFSHGFKGVLSVFITASATVGGSELTGIIAGEAVDPRQSVPRAANSIWFRLGFFYVIGAFMVTLVVPYDHPNLGGIGSAQSPFVIAMNEGGLTALADIFNGVILISLLSAGNSALYAASRTLIGLTNVGLAPKFFSKVDSRGRPWIAVLFTAASGGGLAFLNVSNSGATVFNWVFSLVSLATIWVWWVIFLAHIRFRHGYKAQGGDITDLPFKTWVYPYGVFPSGPPNYRDVSWTYFVHIYLHH